LKPQTIRKIDSYLGKPACFVLTVWRRVVGLVWRRKLPAGGPKKILFIKMIEQGATVLAYRALVRATEIVGRENVYFWVFQENREILDLLDVVPKENVIPLRAKRLLPFARDVIASLFRIRRLGIDATIDMEFFARAPAILAFLTGARRRVGLHRFTSEGPYRGDLLTHRVQYNPYLHTAVNYHLLVEALLRDPAERPLPKVPVPQADYMAPRFRPADEEAEVVRGIVRAQVGRELGGPLVLLNPNASDLLPLRKWATDRFVELGRRILADHPDVTIGITGAPGERAAAEEIAAAIDPARAVNFAGHTTLRQLLVLYALADVLVTNDSGPGHFSSMTDVDTVVMFGPETPALFGPLGPHTHVLWSAIACSPCVNVLNHRFSPCNDNVCMQRITVDDAVDKVRTVLAERARRGIALPVLAGPVVPAQDSGLRTH